ncbi:hypothetical protein, partial [Vibrio vulnificus]|uniref:hypothetical protein n=1 Tax=Vibrio vulnificus TaxID=672 RepID=UPI001CDB7E71
YHFQQLASSSTPFHECRTYYLKSGPTLKHIEPWLDVLSSVQGFAGLLCIGIFISALVSKVKEY